LPGKLEEEFHVLGGLGLRKAQDLETQDARDEVSGGRRESATVADAPLQGD
jgi:hypothetical protein